MEVLEKNKTKQKRGRVLIISNNLWKPFFDVLTHLKSYYAIDIPFVHNIAQVIDLEDDNKSTDKMVGR